MGISHKKTQLLNLTLQLPTNTLVSQSQIKILGCIFDREATSVADLNNTLKICYYTLNKIRKISKFTNAQTRTLFIRSYVLSRLNYMCITHCSLPQYLLTKIHKLVMACVRLSEGSYGFKVRCSTLLEKNKK